MKRCKMYTGLLLAVVLCLSLTACGDSNGSDVGRPDADPNVGRPDADPNVSESDVDHDVVGTDWRTTGIWRSDGTITRDGEDTDVLVCVHKEDATFYYDTENQVLFDSVDYPITIGGDAWEAFQSINFADLNGDGNSDVTMRFDDGGSELLMVWFWDTESNQFVYQPAESQLGEGDDGRSNLVPDDGEQV